MKGWTLSSVSKQKVQCTLCITLIFITIIHLSADGFTDSEKVMKTEAIVQGVSLKLRGQRWLGLFDVQQGWFVSDLLIRDSSEMVAVIAL